MQTVGWARSSQRSLLADGLVRHRPGCQLSVLSSQEDLPCSQGHKGGPGMGTRLTDAKGFSEHAWCTPARGASASYELRGTMRAAVLCTGG